MRAQPALRSIGLAPPRPSPCLLKRAIQLQPDDSECGFVIESDSEPDEPTPQLQAAGRRGFTRLRRASDHNQRPSTREDPLHPRSARGAAAGLESDSDNVDPFPLPSARRSSLHKSVEFISEPLPEALSPARLSSGAPIDAVPWACAEHKGGSREAQTSAVSITSAVMNPMLTKYMRPLQRAILAIEQALSQRGVVRRDWPQLRATWRHRIGYRGPQSECITLADPQSAADEVLCSTTIESLRDMLAYLERECLYSAKLDCSSGGAAGLEDAWLRRRSTWHARLSTVSTWEEVEALIKEFCSGIGARSALVHLRAAENFASSQSVDGSDKDGQKPGAQLGKGAQRPVGMMGGNSCLDAAFRSRRGGSCGDILGGSASLRQESAVRGGALGGGLLGRGSLGSRSLRCRRSAVDYNDARGADSGDEMQQVGDCAVGADVSLGGSGRWTLQAGAIDSFPERLGGLQGRVRRRVPVGVPERITVGAIAPVLSTVPVHVSRHVPRRARTHVNYRDAFSDSLSEAEQDGDVKEACGGQQAGPAGAGHFPEGLLDAREEGLDHRGDNDERARLSCGVSSPDSNSPIFFSRLQRSRRGAAKLRGQMSVALSSSSASEDGPPVVPARRLTRHNAKSSARETTVVTQNEQNDIQRRPGRSRKERSCAVSFSENSDDGEWRSNPLPTPRGRRRRDFHGGQNGVARQRFRGNPAGADASFPHTDESSEYEDRNHGDENEDEACDSECESVAIVNSESGSLYRPSFGSRSSVAEPAPRPAPTAIALRARAGQVAPRRSARRGPNTPQPVYNEDELERHAGRASAGETSSLGDELEANDRPGTRLAPNDSRTRLGDADSPREITSSGTELASVWGSAVKTFRRIRKNSAKEDGGSGGGGSSKPAQSGALGRRSISASFQEAMDPLSDDSRSDDDWLLTCFDTQRWMIGKYDQGSGQMDENTSRISMKASGWPTRRGYAKSSEIVEAVVGWREHRSTLKPSVPPAEEGTIACGLGGRAASRERIPARVGPNKQLLENAFFLVKWRGRSHLHGEWLTADAVAHAGARRKAELWLKAHLDECMKARLASGYAEPSKGRVVDESGRKGVSAMQSTEADTCFAEDSSGQIVEVLDACLGQSLRVEVILEVKPPAKKRRAVRRSLTRVPLRLLEVEGPGIKGEHGASNQDIDKCKKNINDEAEIQKLTSRKSTSRKSTSRKSTSRKEFEAVDVDGNGTESASGEDTDDDGSGWEDEPGPQPKARIIPSQGGDETPMSGESDMDAPAAHTILHSCALDVDVDSGDDGLMGVASGDDGGWSKSDSPRSFRPRGEPHDGCSYSGAADLPPTPVGDGAVDSRERNEAVAYSTCSMRLPRSRTQILVKWAGLGWAMATWEFWADIRCCEGALRAWQDFHQLALAPPAPALSSTALQRARAEPFDAPTTPVAPPDVEHQLHDYQREGVRWLLANWHAGRSAVLADEMGLGKTAQALLMLGWLARHRGVHGPFLVIAPLSTLEHWQREARRWTSMRAAVLSGPKEDRKVILKHLLNHTDENGRRTTKAFATAAARARDINQVGAIGARADSLYEVEELGEKATDDTAADEKGAGVLRFEVLVTSYENLGCELSALTSVRWRHIVVDEAHRLKNPKSKLATAVRLLCGTPPASRNEAHLHDNSAPLTTLLTGTPVQNNPMELLSLMSFVDPHAFAAEKRETNLLERFGRITRVEQISELQSLLRPYMLRRVKEDVIESLPKKTETLLKVELTVPQKRLYRAVIDRNLAAITNPRASLSNAFMQLRKVCNHPRLLEGGAAYSDDAILEKAIDAASVLAEIRSTNRSNRTTPVEGGAVDKLRDSQANVHVISREARGLLRAANESSDAVAAAKHAAEDEERITALEADVVAGIEVLTSGSGKMLLLHKLLPLLKERKAKVLIFSQFSMVLDLLEDYLHLRAPDLGSYERLDGSVSGPQRQAAIDRFQAEEDVFCFLLTTRAGGQGINLTAANTVILFDSDWNPQGDLQGQARAHRIGQQKPVKVYRLITNNTYELRLFERACLKLSLEQALLQGGHFSQEALGAQATAKCLQNQASLQPLGGHSRSRAMGEEVFDFASGSGASSSEDEDVGAIAGSQLDVGSLNRHNSASHRRGGGQSLSRAELEELLRYGAYGILRDGADQESRSFCDADIGQILEEAVDIEYDDDNEGGEVARDSNMAERHGCSSQNCEGSGRSLAVSTSSRVTARIVGGGLSFFSRASFVPGGSNALDDISLDDPDFWTKMVAMQKPSVIGSDIASADGHSVLSAEGGPRRRRLAAPMTTTLSPQATGGTASSRPPSRANPVVNSALETLQTGGVGGDPVRAPSSAVVFMGKASVESSSVTDTAVLVLQKDAEESACNSHPLEPCNAVVSKPVAASIMTAKSGSGGKHSLAASRQAAGSRRTVKCVSESSKVSLGAMLREPSGDDSKMIAKRSRASLNEMPSPLGKTFPASTTRHDQPWPSGNSGTTRDTATGMSQAVPKRKAASTFASSSSAIIRSSEALSVCDQDALLSASTSSDVFQFSSQATPAPRVRPAKVRRMSKNTDAPLCKDQEQQGCLGVATEGRPAASSSGGNKGGNGWKIGTKSGRPHLSIDNSNAVAFHEAKVPACAVAAGSESAVSNVILPSPCVVEPPAPLLDLWSLQPDERVCGHVFGKANVRDGAKITTAPILGLTGGAAAMPGMIVTTATGSRYALGERAP